MVDVAFRARSGGFSATPRIHRVGATAVAPAAQALGKITDVRITPPGCCAAGAGPAGDPWALFLAGYRDYGGREEWAQGFVVALQCEGSRWEGYVGDYTTRAQFSRDTWAKVVRHFEGRGIVVAPDDPYFVGQAVAWWSNAIAAEGKPPRSQSGWPVCFP
jgi:hypothetical protein